MSNGGVVQAEDRDNRTIQSTHPRVLQERPMQLALRATQNDRPRPLVTRHRHQPELARVTNHPAHVVSVRAMPAHLLIPAQPDTRLRVIVRLIRPQHNRYLAHRAGHRQTPSIRV
jgi:hypothetical protein